MLGTYTQTDGELTDTHMHSHTATCITNTAHVLTPGPVVRCESGWGQEGPHSVSVHIIQKNKAFFPQ